MVSKQYGMELRQFSKIGVSPYLLSHEDCNKMNELNGYHFVYITLVTKTTNCSQKVDLKTSNSHYFFSIFQQMHEQLRTQRIPGFHSGGLGSITGIGTIMFQVNQRF